MPVILLRSVSSKPEGISGTRIVRYRVQRINRYWWKLTVTIPLRFHFCFPILWTDDRRDSFRAGMASAVRSWSRRHLLRSSTIFGTTHVEVHVESHTRGGPNEELWHVVALPPGVDQYVQSPSSGTPGKLLSQAWRSPASSSVPAAPAQPAQ